MCAYTHPFVMACSFFPIDQGKLSNGHKLGHTVHMNFASEIMCHANTKGHASPWKFMLTSTAAAAAAAA